MRRSRYKPHEQITSSRQRNGSGVPRLKIETFSVPIPCSTIAWGNQIVPTDLKTQIVPQVIISRHQEGK
jgi:hypothetical protein